MKKTTKLVVLILVFCLALTSLVACDKSCKHDFGQLIEEVPATCVARGTAAHYKCSLCGKTFDQNKNETNDLTLPIKGHNFGSLIPEVPADCDNTGTIAHYHCDRCGKDFNTQKKVVDSLEIPAEGHNYGKLNSAVAPTCTQEGQIAYYECQDCGTTFNEEKQVVETLVVPATGHNYGELIVGTAATCTTDGTIDHYKCSVCDTLFDENKEEVQTTVIPGGHTLGDWIEEVSATCITTGTKGHYYCSVCEKNIGYNGTIEITDLVIPTTGHSYTNAVCVNCNDDKTDELIDYAGQAVLDQTNALRKRLEVTVHAYIDGDTVHFNVPDSEVEGGVLKARFLGVDTPESTGRIENYGKTASRYTKETLLNAQKIIIESETTSWNADSTGSRYLVWVWYLPKGESTWHNLNLEILQKGYAIGSKITDTAYYDQAYGALLQARNYGLVVHSDIPDPEVYAGDAITVTLKELRCNTAEYNSVRVAFKGIVAINSGSNAVYVEDYDEETGLYYGIQVYYGFNLSGEGLRILTPGNEVLIVGVVQYYENGGYYQVSDLRYSAMRPDDPLNIQVISTGHKGSYKETTIDEFFNGKITTTIHDSETDELVEKTFTHCELSMHASISMTNLKVVDIWTTKNEASASKGAMTLTCRDANGNEIDVRTVVLYDDNNEMITESAYLNKTINVQGIVDYYDGTYQIKVFDDQYIQIVK